MSRKINVSLDNKCKAWIRYHKRWFKPGVISLDWAESENGFAIHKAYSYFEKVIIKRGVKKIETEGHEYSANLLSKLGYRYDDRKTGNIDPSYITMAKYL